MGADYTRKLNEIPECPACGDRRGIKAGRSISGKQRYRCRCGRYFVVDPGVPAVIKDVVDRLSGEGIGPAVISRVVAGYCSRRWVYQRVRMHD